MKFDVSSLQGRTIVGAAIGLWAYYPPAIPTQYKVGALSQPWSTTTLTYNNLPPRYTYGEWWVNSRSTPGLLGWNVTDIVRQWASNGWANNGVVFEDVNWVLPNATLLCATSFYSTDYYFSADCRPYLVVDYQ